MDKGASLVQQAGNGKRSTPNVQRLTEELLVRQPAQVSDCPIVQLWLTILG